MMNRHKVLKIPLTLFAALLLAGLTAFFFPQQVLTVDSGPVKADALVVLGGLPDRAVRAAELFKRGDAPLVICTGYGDARANESYLTNSGVPAADVLLESKSHSTRENAEFSIPLLRQMGARRVIIVTSWFHSRRALACFEHYAPDIRFYSRPSYAGYVGGNEDAEIGKAENRKTDHGTTDDGWGGGNMEMGKTNGGNFSVSEFQLSAFNARRKAERKAREKHVKSEYLKLLGYWVRYGVWPL
jgi:hypothetical protein